MTADTHAFRGVLGTRVKICKPADPEAKGLVERGNGYLETSFLPGRTFASPADFNTQLRLWLPLANGRTKRPLGCAPTDRVDADRQAMLPLPPVAPLTGWSQTLRLPRDHYVRLDSNDYSVHPSAVGRCVDVTADLERVRVVCDGRPVADHERVWDIHQTISDPCHVEAAKTLRHERPTTTRGVASELAFLTRTLKAPTLRDAVDRLAERARAEAWTHEEFLAACLQREVSARDAHGGEGRIRAARFPARKSLEEFDFDHARGLERDQIAHLGTLDFVTGKENAIFLGPSDTDKTHLATGLAIRACQAGHRVLFRHRVAVGRPPGRRSQQRSAARGAGPAGALPVT